MTDSLTKRKRSAVMAAIPSRGNRATELRLASLFRESGIIGWRRGLSLPGKPDFVFRREHIAVFVDGCFWHGCRWHCRMPKSRQTYWEPKISRNKSRDRAISRVLKQAGWRVHRIWEHSLAQPDAVIAKLRLVLRRASRQGTKAT